MSIPFGQLGLKPQLVDAVSTLGYTEPTPIQKDIIPLMLAGYDVIGQAQTGTGKTAAFGLPMLHNLAPNQRHVQALVLVPTRELALQVAEALEGFGQVMRPRVLAVYGGQAYSRQTTALRQGVDVVVGTPGRLLDLIDRRALNLNEVSLVVLDEADEMLGMGFIEDIESILSHTPTTRQTALFSATLPQEIRRLADRHLREPRQVTVQRTQLTGESIEQQFCVVNESDKVAALTRFFEVEEVTRAIVFVRTRAGTGDLANELSIRGFPAEALSGELSQEARERTLARFRQDQIKVLVATDVAARGLDIEGISHVFNFDLPDDPEVYVHRIGRTGRAGRTGKAISLFSPAERRKLRQIEGFTRQRLAQIELPSVAAIQAQRDRHLAVSLEQALSQTELEGEHSLLDQLLARGFSPLDLAAAALKLARADEQRRPIAPIGPVRERERDRDSTASRSRGPRSLDTRSPARGGQGGSRRPGALESGMVRLSLGIGRAEGVKPNEIVGRVAYHANIPGSAIGKILIQEHQTLVDIPEGLAAQVVAKNMEIRIRQHPVSVQRA